MFLFLRNTKPRKTDRNRSSRYRAKLKAKNKARRGRIYCAGRALAAFAPPSWPSAHGRAPSGSRPFRVLSSGEIQGAPRSA